MIRGRLRGIHGRSLRPYRLLLFAGAVLMMVQLTATAAGAAGSHVGFGFNASSIGGFPTGQVTLTGGGAFDVSTGFAHAEGSFSCTSPVSQGPLAGCLAGEGVRWDTEALLSETTFKCTGSASEALKPISADEDTAVLQADFYRAGDGIDESFTANIIVAGKDIAPDIDGFQNVWVQGVGCATATVHLSS
jgi:hypothetical protein